MGRASLGIVIPKRESLALGKVVSLEQYDVKVKPLYGNWKRMTINAVAKGSMIFGK